MFMAYFIRARVIGISDKIISKPSNFDVNLIKNKITDYRFNLKTKKNKK